MNKVKQAMTFSVLVLIALTVFLYICPDNRVKAAATNENIALNKPIVDYSSNYETPQWGNSINFLTDGRQDTNWASEINSGHTSQDAIEYLTVDLQSEYKVSKVVVAPHFDFSNTQQYVATTFPEKYQVQVSKDGVNFTTVATYNQVMTNAAPVVHNFTPVVARYVRIYMTRISSTAIIANNFYVQLSEIEVYGEISDKNALEVEINKLTGANLDAYTEVTVAAFNKALNSAKSVLNNASSTEADYKAALDKLKAAADGLMFIYYGKNVALNKPVLTDNSYKAPEGIFDESYLTDGLNPPTSLVYETHNAWSIDPASNISRDTPVDVVIDLEKKHIVKVINIYPAKYDTSMFPNTFEVYTSADGTTWQLAGTTTNATNVSKEAVFRYKVNDVVARYVKIHITKHSDISYGAFISQIGEAEVYGYEQSSVDKKPLTAKIDEAQNIDLTNKADALKTALLQATANAKAAVEDPAATQTTVTNRLNTLVQAINALKEQVPETGDPISFFILFAVCFSAILLKRKRQTSNS